MRAAERLERSPKRAVAVSRTPGSVTNLTRLFFDGPDRQGCFDPNLGSQIAPHRWRRNLGMPASAANHHRGEITPSMNTTAVGRPGIAPGERASRLGWLVTLRELGDKEWAGSDFYRTSTAFGRSDHHGSTFVQAGRGHQTSSSSTEHNQATPKKRATVGSIPPSSTLSENTL